MNLRKELLGGLVSLLLSVGIVLGSFSLALIETKAVKITALLPTATLQPTPERPTVPAGSPTLTLEPSNTSTITPTPIPPTNCPPPLGWQAYTILHGDTLEDLAARFSTTKENIMRANCMVVGSLLPNTTIYLPAPTLSPTLTSSPTMILTPTITLTRILCGAPPGGWIPYTIHSGDTLFHLAWAFNVSIYELQAANCMDGSTFLVAGSTIYVPNVATRTTSPTPATPTTTTSPTPTSPTPTSPTATPSLTVQPTISQTPTITLTLTLTPTCTATTTITPTPTTTTTGTNTPTTTSTGTSTTTLTSTGLP